MQEYVAGFLFDQESENVLLIEKLKPEWQAGKLNGIGGKIEPGESPDQAIAREFKEETGIRTRAFRVFCILTDHKKRWRVHFYKAHGHLECAEQIEREKPVIVPVEKLPMNTISNLKWLIPLALDPSGTEARAMDFAN